MLIGRGSHLPSNLNVRASRYARGRGRAPIPSITPTRALSSTPSTHYESSANPSSPLTTNPKSPTPPESLAAFGERHVTRGLGRITKGIMVRGEGSYVYYDDGRKYLDFTCGIGVTNLGHAHPKVSKAAAEQCMKLVHSQCSISLHEPYIRLIERLLPTMPHPSLNSFFFWNSGSEAVEAAIKMARIITGRQNVITMQGAYHGRTYGAMALTRSKTVYSRGMGPLMPGVFVAPYPYTHQLTPSHPFPSPSSVSHPSSSRPTPSALALHALDILLAQQTAPADTAAIILEPVLGEGGYVPAPQEYLEGVRERCEREGMLLVVDEVQSGFGRTGGVFACSPAPGESVGEGGHGAQGEWARGVRPDILVMAKGLGNGFPISGVVSRKELTDLLPPGSMGGTYAGNAVSCAAACAVQDVMREENILENVRVRSEQLFAALNTLRADPLLAPHILDVRGRGLMVGVEFGSRKHRLPINSEAFSTHSAASLPESSPSSPSSPSSHPDTVKHEHTHGKHDHRHPANLASRIAQRCVDRGLLILTTSVYEVIRFIPPLNVTRQEMEEGVRIFGECVREVVREG